MVGNECSSSELCFPVGDVDRTPVLDRSRIAIYVASGAVRLMTPTALIHIFIVRSEPKRLFSRVLSLSRNICQCYERCLISNCLVCCVRVEKHMGIGFGKGHSIRDCSRMFSNIGFCHSQSPMPIFVNWFSVSFSRPLTCALCLRHLADNNPPSQWRTLQGR